MPEYLIIGVILGLSAGLAPGPLLTLVVSESLRHGIGSGMKVACAPIISDLPIVLFTLFVMARLAGYEYGLGGISLAGGIFMLTSGYGIMCTQAAVATTEHEPSRSLRKGVTANLLNPHPYLFWLTVGGPTMNKAHSMGTVASVAFISGFYLALVGSKIILAVAVGKSRSFLSGTVYRYTLRFLGMILCVFAFVLFRDGAKMLGLI